MSVWHYLESKFYFPLPKIKPVFCKEKKKKKNGFIVTKERL